MICSSGNRLFFIACFVSTEAASTIEHPEATASLLEGMEETVTVNRLRLTPALVR